MSSAGDSAPRVASAREPRSDAAGALDVAFSLRGVRKQFGFREVLRGVNWHAARGGIHGLLGPNGAGKSTILRIIAGQSRATSGRVTVASYSAASDPDKVKRAVGVVSHASFLRSELTLWENLRLTAALFGLTWNDVAGRAEERLRELSMWGRRDDRVGTFSQGMRKRSDLVRSLLHEPEVWILDEPFAGLDPSGCDVLRRLILEFRGAGGTVLLVTHQTSIARELATHVGHLDGGKLHLDYAADVRSGGGSPAGEEV